MMQLGGGHRALGKRLEALAKKAVRIQQYLIAEKDIIDANDASFVQVGITQLIGAAMQRVVEGVMDVVVEVGARADHEINRATLHQCENAAADTSGCHG